jgi:maleylpyruvate isomerase
MKLYNFFRSGTSHRVRIALRFKGLEVEYVPVNLRTEQHLSDEYKALNPQGLVPALVHEGRVLIQSPAIIEWLEERYPTPALLPADIDERARVRALAALVGSDIHPINNRRILEFLRKNLDADEKAITAWCQHWIVAGFDALETILAADERRRDFCFGSSPTLADVYLVPQVESARRFKVDMTRWPRIQAVDAACAQIEAFRLAAPALQPDAGEEFFSQHSRPAVLQAPSAQTTV